MKIDVIVPSNNIKELNGFISSFDTLSEFKKHANLIIIGNGEVYYNEIEGGHSVNYDCIRDDNDYSNSIVPFVKLNGLGMVSSNCDFFLQLDDDHRFPEGSDDFLLKCIKVLENNNCSVLCTDRERNGNKGLFHKRDGYIWSNRGLFIKNVLSKKEIEKHYNLLGAGVDLFFSYLVLEKTGFPYELFGSPITRKEKRYINNKKIYDVSYDDKTLYENILGFIINRYNDKKWKHQPNNNYPIKLQHIMYERMCE